MIGISIAAKKEWEAVLNKLNMNIAECNTFPFGEYFKTNIYGEDVIFYRCGVRKMNCSASTQYMIDHFDLSKIIVAGTCAGIDDSYKNLDIFFPNKLVQYEKQIRLIKKCISKLMKCTHSQTANRNCLSVFLIAHSSSVNHRLPKSDTDFPLLLTQLIFGR